MAEFYDLIRVYGLPESKDECFQGLGAAALYNVAADAPFSGGQEPPTASGSGAGSGGGSSEEPIEEPVVETLPDALWTAQTEVIKRQSDFLMTISGTYADKLKALPQQPSWWTVLGDSLLAWGVDELLGIFIHGADAAADATPVSRALEMFVSFLVEFTFNAWDYIKDYYNETGKICMQMKSENDALCALPNSRDNYLLRTATLQQHDATSKNLIELIDALEQDLRRAMQPLPQDFTALVQAIQDLRFNGSSLQFPDGHVFTMVGGTVSQETPES